MCLLCLCVCVFSGPSHSDGPPAVWRDSQHHESKMGQCRWRLWLHAAVCTTYGGRRPGRERGERTKTNIPRIKAFFSFEIFIKELQLRVQGFGSKCYICGCLSPGQGIRCGDRAGDRRVGPQHWIQRHCLCHVWRRGRWPYYKSAYNMWVRSI